MLKWLVIIVLIALAFVSVRYRANETLQKVIVYGISGSLLVYLVTIVVMELLR